MKHKSEYSPEETARLDAQRIAAAVQRGGDRSRVFGSSKHRGSRIQKFKATQRRKKRKR